ncbi:MAG: alkyl sulfatase C-terminal domain-containing protein [Promethearchaeota archaeon]
MTKKEEFLNKVKQGTLKGRDLLIFVDAVQELADENEDVQELLEDLKEENENITLNFIVEDINISAAMIIKNGILKTQHSVAENPDVVIKIPKESTAQQILEGKLSMLDAYKKGEIKAEGELSKAMGLGILMNIIGDELGVL